MGHVVVLTKGLHPEFFAELAESGEAEFELSLRPRIPLGTDNDPFRRPTPPGAGQNDPQPPISTPSQTWPTCG